MNEKLVEQLTNAVLTVHNTPQGAKRETARVVLARLCDRATADEMREARLRAGDLT